MPEFGLTPRMQVCPMFNCCLRIKPMAVARTTDQQTCPSAWSGGSLKACVMASGMKSLCLFPQLRIPNWRMPKQPMSLMAWIACGNTQAHGPPGALESVLRTNWDPTPQTTLNFGMNLSGRTFRTLGSTLTITQVEEQFIWMMSTSGLRAWTSLIKPRHHQQQWEYRL